MPKMTASEVDTFLGEPGHLLRLATTDDAGAPLVVPIWFIYEDGASTSRPASGRRGASTSTETPACVS